MEILAFVIGALIIGGMGLMIGWFCPLWVILIFTAIAVSLAIAFGVDILKARQRRKQAVANKPTGNIGLDLIGLLFIGVQEGCSALTILLFWSSTIFLAALWIGTLLTKFHLAISIHVH